MSLFGRAAAKGPSYDPGLIPGARNAIDVCLGVRRDQAVYILTDRASETVGRALYDAARRSSGSVTIQVLEDHVERPARELPPAIMDNLEKCQVCLYAVFPQANELASRIQFVKQVEQKGIRYAHMVGITEAIMCQGMRADFRKVDEVSRRLMKFARKAHKIQVKSRCGTDLVATFNPKYTWRKTSGIVEEVWSNLPGGEIFTFPESVDGIFMVDGTIGDHFSSKYGVLSETPMRLEIAGGYLKKVECANQELEKEFWDYCHAAPGSDRVGEFAIGTNLAIFEFVGNLLQDEKMPGVHIAFGDPYASQTGADWSCSTHVDVIVGFNVRPDPAVKRLADQENVNIRLYRVIYTMLDEVRKAMAGLLAPDISEVELGRVEVRQVFKITKVGKVAGCYVLSGKVTRDSEVRLLRDSVVIYEGRLESLKRFKDDVREVTEGYECGLSIVNYPDLQQGDIIEAYRKEITIREDL